MGAIRWPPFLVEHKTQSGWGGEQKWGFFSFWRCHLVPHNITCQPLPWHELTTLQCPPSAERLHPPNRDSTLIRVSAFCCSGDRLNRGSCQMLLDHVCIRRHALLVILNLDPMEERLLRLKPSGLCEHRLRHAAFFGSNGVQSHHVGLQVALFQFCQTHVCIKLFGGCGICGICQRGGPCRGGPHKQDEANICNPFAQALLFPAQVLNLFRVRAR